MHNIAIFGVPRSGTSWIGQIFNSSPHVVYRYQPIFAYSFEGSIEEDSTSEEIQKFHQDLLQTDDDFVCQKRNISGNPAPKFNKSDLTHLVWKEVRYLNIIQNLIENSSIKVVGVVRHPCGVLKSWMNAPKEFNETWEIEEEWRHAGKKNKGKHDFYGFEQWITAAEGFINFEKKYPDQFRTIVYESLLQNPNNEIESLFNFTELELTNQTQAFLKDSTTKSSNDPYDVYRKNKKVDEWTADLPSSIIEKVLDDERFKNIDKRVKWNILWNQT